MKSHLLNSRLWLCILIFASIWVILSADLDILPLISCDFTEEFIFKLNKSLVNIAYSIIAAFIFYIFTSTLPRKIKIYRSKRVVSKQIHQLLFYELFILIKLILKAYDIKKDISEIEEKDLLHIDGNISTSLTGYYRTLEYWNTRSKKGKTFTGYKNKKIEFEKIIVTKLNEIPQLIDKIRIANPQFYIHEKFAEILASIETNKLIEWYGKKSTPIFRLESSSRELYYLIKDYKKLLNLKYHIYYRNTYQTIDFYSDEIKDITPDRKTLNITSEKIKTAISLKPCIIYNSEYSDSRSFIAELTIGGYVVYDEIVSKKTWLSKYNNSIVPHEESKCIIIIGEMIPRKQIKEFIKLNKDKKVIIWLKSNLFYSSPKFKTTKPTSFGVYKVYYRRPFSFFKLFIIGRKYPTKKIILTINNSIENINRNFISNK